MDSSADRYSPRFSQLEKVIIILVCGSAVILILLAIITELITGNWRERLAISILCGIIGILLLWLDILSPASWLRRKLFLVYGDNNLYVVEGRKEINGKKTTFANAKDDNNGILYTYFPREKSLHISKRIFLDPLHCTEEYDALLTQFKTRIEKLQLPVQIIDHRCQTMHYADIELVIKKCDASEETLRSLKTILCKLNDTESHVYIHAVFQTEVWFIEAYRLFPIWSAVDVYELEIPEGVDRSEYIDKSAKYRPNMILQHIYNGTILDDEPEICFMTKEEMIHCRPDYADYVKDAEHTDLQNAKSEFLTAPEDVEYIKNAEPEEIMRLFDEAMKYDQDDITEPCVTRLIDLVRLNKHKTQIAILFRNMYRDHLLLPQYEYAGPASYYIPVTFAGWGDMGINQLFNIQPETFEDGYIEIECDVWNNTNYRPKIVEDLSSGVSVAEIRDNSILLKIDASKVKTGINTVGNTIEELYQLALDECGEFVVKFYYRGKDNSKIRLYSQDFIIK